MQVKSLVVLMKFEAAAIRQRGVSENDPWFHVVLLLSQRKNSSKSLTSCPQNNHPTLKT
jgi:hypothetical protein